VQGLYVEGYSELTSLVAAFLTGVSFLISLRLLPLEILRSYKLSFTGSIRSPTYKGKTAG